MAITNQERVGKALDLLKDGLQPFVERERCRTTASCSAGLKSPGWAHQGSPATSLRQAELFQ